MVSTKAASPSVALLIVPPATPTQVKPVFDRRILLAWVRGCAGPVKLGQVAVVILRAAVVVSMGRFSKVASAIRPVLPALMV